MLCDFFFVAFSAAVTLILIFCQFEQMPQFGETRAGWVMTSLCCHLVLFIDHFLESTCHRVAAPDQETSETVKTVKSQLVIFTHINEI